VLSKPETIKALERLHWEYDLVQADKAYDIAVFV
jgi:hypothetical protein